MRRTQQQVLLAVAIALIFSAFQLASNVQLSFDGSQVISREEEMLQPSLKPFHSTKPIYLLQQSSNSTKNKTEPTAPISKAKAPDTSSTSHKYLLSVPFYVYEELIWETATWDGKPLQDFVNVANGNNPKHADDYFFMKAALQHPMRTLDPSEAKIFVIPSLNNLFDSRAYFKKKNLCWKGMCNGKLMNHAGHVINATGYFHAHPEAHIAVASHFAHHKAWWIGRLPKLIRDILYSSHNIGFEGYKTNHLDRLHFPKIHVGQACPREVNKSQDVALIATIKSDDARFRDRETICSWITANETATKNPLVGLRVAACGWGQMCPALAQAKLGFHVRGDTLSSNRLFDTILSGTVPIFTLKKQYEVVPSWIDWKQISYLIDVEETTESQFRAQLQAILDNKELYEQKRRLIEQNKKWFDWKTMYPFDMYLYMLQIHLYPETRHSAGYLDSSIFLMDRSDKTIDKAIVGNFSGPINVGCTSTTRCQIIDLGNAKFSYVHISKNAGVSWIREFKKLKQVPKNLPGSPSMMRDNFPNVGLYPIADSGAEHGAQFQDDFLKEHRPYYRMITLRSPRHQVWSMFSHCYYSKWGKKATKNYFPRSHPENDVLDFEIWLDHFLNENKTDLYRDTKSPILGCYHPQNYQSRAIISWEESPRQPKREGYEPDFLYVTEMFESFDWVALTAFFHESKCLLYYRLNTDSVDPEISKMVEHYLDTTCRCMDDEAGTPKDEVLDEKMTHAVKGHRSSLLDLSDEILRKIDILTRTDLALYQLSLETFMKEVVWLESKLNRRVLCDPVLLKWGNELAYVGRNLTELYLEAKQKKGLEKPILLN